jgi:cytochrome c oxidase cbb3-type subunit 3
MFVSVAQRQSVASVQSAKGKGGVAASYDTHCAKCHGKDGKGIESLQPPDFTDSKWQADNTDKMISDGIRNGKGVMPGFKDVLNTPQTTAMVKYVRAFRPKSAKSPKK